MFLHVLFLLQAGMLNCVALQASFLSHASRITKPMTLRKSGCSFLQQRTATIPCLSSSTRLLDKEDPNDVSDSNSKDNSLVWTSLATTEEWIQRTLNMPTAPKDNNPGGRSSPTNDNPYTRKEVSYDCETSSSVPRIISSVFRRLREMREAGEDHGRVEDQLLQQRRRTRTDREDERPTTYRQTLVVVIPTSEYLTTSFEIFDALIQRINEARRNARDYVTEESLERVQNSQNEQYQDSRMPEEEWVTSVNLAHLHPNFGEEEKQSVESDENEDPKIKAYKLKKMQARRSPFPSLVIEVKSLPPTPPAEGMSGQAAPQSASANSNKDTEEDVSFSDVQKLEALFGKAASPTSGEETDGNSAYAEEYSFLSPVGVAQNWITSNDPMYNPDGSCSFSASDITQVDAAYEFVFHSIASAIANGGTRRPGREYLILPRFLPRSATSLEKFANQLQRIIDVVPGIGSTIKVVTFHKEHVDKDRRSPVPVLALDWEELAFE